MPRPGTRRRPFIVTTTITVLRVPDDDPDEPRDGADPEPEREEVHAGTPATIGVRVAREDRGQQSAGRQVTPLRLVCDLIDLNHTDQVRDNTTGLVWAVGGVTNDVRLGLNYTSAEILRVDGPLG